MASHHRYPRRARRSWCAGLAVVVVAGLLAYAGTVSAAARAAAPPGSADSSAGGLLSVRLNLGGPSGPAAVATLGVPTAGVDQLQVTLNGHPVALPPVTGSGAQRVLNLAELGGLRFGTNQLQVRLVMTDGAVQAISRTFTLSGQRDIAAARALTPATTGRTVTLDASRSLLVPGTGGLATARWTLVRRPAGSHARLGSAAGAQVTLRPDLPGYYLVGLRVGSGPATGVDLLTVRGTYPELLVPFNTMAQTADVSPKPGIQIEDSFFQDPVDSSGRLGALQMVVLNRSTLFEYFDRGFTGDEQGIALAASYLESNFNSPDYLVIITHPGPGYGTPAISTDSNTIAALETLVGMIGGTVPGQWAFPDSRCWPGATDQCYGDTAKWQRNTWYTDSFSFIGVRGMPAGQAWRETAAQLGTPDGNGLITGFFTQGALGESGTDNYTVVNGPDPYVPVQTCTTDGCDVTVGDHAYAPEAGVSSGMHVVVLSRTTLNLITNTTVTTADGLDTALQSSTRPVVGDYAGPPTVDDQRLVILQSIGTGKLSGPVPASLLQYISQFGGTPDYLWDAISSAPGPACRYALIGAAADLPWQGTAAESSTAMKHGYTTATGPDCSTAVGLPTGQLAGTLQRDRDGLYAPGATNAAGVTDNSLYQIMFSPGPYQPDQAWPMDDDVTGLTYVADHIGLCPGGDSPCYPDVRSAYTDDGIDFESKLALLVGLPDSCDPSVCGPDFPALKIELGNEFDWVNDVRKLMDNLRLPYEAAGPATVFSVKDVTQNVVNALKETEDQKKATMQWLGTFSKVMTVGQAVAKIAGNDLAAEVFGKLSDAGVLATEWLTPPSGVSADSVTAAAYQLAETINGQQLAYIEWTYLAQDILVSTYQQLHAAGTKIWSFDGISFTNQVSALSGSAAASAYSALFPVAWDGYNLKPGPWLPGSDDVSAYECSEIGPNLTFYSDYPFRGALPEHQFHAITSVDGSGQAVRQVWTFAHIPPPFQSGFPPTPYGFADYYFPYAEPPPGPGPNQVPLTDAIYGPGATGANEKDTAPAAFQYEASWWRSTYNPPSHTICNTSAAYGHTGSQPLSTASPPPDIQKPPV